MTPEPETSSTKPLLTPAKPQEPRSTRHEDLVELLSRKVVGQPTAMQYIVPYIQMHQAGLSPEGRPVGIFLLLGPTGTGKTRTVEALAEVLHDNDKKVLKIDQAVSSSEGAPGSADLGTECATTATHQSDSLVQFRSVECRGDTR